MLVKLSGAVVGLVLLTLAGRAPAMVIKEYTYTGNNFTSASGVFTTGDSFTGSFTLDCSLTASADCSSLPLADKTAAVTDYSFQAGSVVLTPLNTTPVFSFSTSPDMNIVEWFISLNSTTFPSGGTAATFSADISPGVGAEDTIVLDNGANGFGSVPDNQGSWSVATVNADVAVPEPSSVSLVLTGLLSVFLFSAWRQRRAPDPAVRPKS